MVNRGDAVQNVTEFIVDFASQRLTLGSETQARMGMILYAGPCDLAECTNFHTIYQNLNVSEPAASNITKFSQFATPITGTGGTTNTPGALDYVRTTMLRPDNLRPGSKRVVILVTDGYPSDRTGVGSLYYL
jgi:hypothetical protein